MIVVCLVEEDILAVSSINAHSMVLQRSIAPNAVVLAKVFPELRTDTVAALARLNRNKLSGHPGATRAQRRVRSASQTRMKRDKGSNEVVVVERMMMVLDLCDPQPRPSKRVQGRCRDLACSLCPPSDHVVLGLARTGAKEKSRLEISERREDRTETELPWLHDFFVSTSSASSIINQQSLPPTQPRDDD